MVVRTLKVQMTNSDNIVTKLWFENNQPTNQPTTYPPTQY